MSRTYKQSENLWYAENIPQYIGIDHKQNGMVSAHPTARTMRLGIRIDDNGKYDVFLNDGIAIIRSGKFDTFEAADAEIENIMLQYKTYYKNTTMMPFANYVRTYGKKMVSKYAGRDILGNNFEAGAEIYYSNRGTLISNG